MKAVHLGKPRCKLPATDHIIRLFGPVRRQVSRRAIQKHILSKPLAARLKGIPKGSQSQGIFSLPGDYNPGITFVITGSDDLLWAPRAFHRCGRFVIQHLHPERIPVSL